MLSSHPGSCHVCIFKEVRPARLSIVGDVATSVTFNGIRPARLSIGTLRRMPHAAPRPPSGCSAQCLAPMDRTAPSTRKAERPLAARSVAKGRMRMPSDCWSSQTPCLASAGGSRTIRRTIAPPAGPGQGNSGHWPGRASGVRKKDRWLAGETRAGAHQGLLLNWRSGGPAPTFCAWFSLGRVAPMAGKRFAVFMRSYVHILCSIGREDGVFADHTTGR